MNRKPKKYILFTGEAHDKVKFEFTTKQIEIFITLWNLGCPINKIVQRLCTSQVSAALIAMVLEMSGRIKQRIGGLLGEQKVVS
ncbi:hypothetical protein [Lysinibacillus sp. BPa_S21]|nr:hypothetical protein [Lysinibacillus sp. BPa_S21]